MTAATLICPMAGLCATPAQALNILLCTDDGISAANVRALKQGLVAAGHSGVLTAPVDNQSGHGGYTVFCNPCLPDLVISSPNEGNNTGHINASSGTFNNLLYVSNRGLPAMAVSDATTAHVTWSGTLAPTHRAFEVADIVLRPIDDVPDAKPTRRRQAH